mmetsp:Transcript_37005/g.54317  ORF Transcript_37005/g.54317 Transcript_37005/m.54317 type:complete len:351 (-) Transcript_37005:54-1106(-)
MSTFSRFSNCRFSCTFIALRCCTSSFNLSSSDSPTWTIVSPNPVAFSTPSLTVCTGLLRFLAGGLVLAFLVGAAGAVFTAAAAGGTGGKVSGRTPGANSSRTKFVRSAWWVSCGEKCSRGTFFLFCIDKACCHPLAARRSGISGTHACTCFPTRDCTRRDSSLLCAIDRARARSHSRRGESCSRSARGALSNLRGACNAPASCCLTCVRLCSGMPESKLPRLKAEADEPPGASRSAPIAAASAVRILLFAMSSFQIGLCTRPAILLITFSPTEASSAYVSFTRLDANGSATSASRRCLFAGSALSTATQSSTTADTLPAATAMRGNARRSLDPSSDVACIALFLFPGSFH